MMDEWLVEAAEVRQVTDLTRQIKASLEADFSRVWVQGEVSNLRRQSSATSTFPSKTPAASCPVLFNRDAARQDFTIEEGMEILLLGDISVYEPHGRYQLVAKIALQAGLGQLQAQFEQLKQKLSKKDSSTPPEKALPTPAKHRRHHFPTGAALRDFLRILSRRYFKGRVVVFPTRVQGKGAAEEIKPCSGECPNRKSTSTSLS